MASAFLQTIRNVGRLTHIVNVFARYGFKKELQTTELGELLTFDAAGVPQPREELSRSRRLVLAFEELGPTFVKLGQFLAAREDLLPANAIREFQRLQDNAKPFPADLLEKIISEAFQGKHQLYFSSIDPVPLGAASIGQVHKAILKDGKEVVLKVQRPEVEQIIQTDLSILKGIAGLLESAFPELRQLRPKLIIDQLRKSIQLELDYVREASSTEKMRAFFEGNEEIHIPEIFRDLCHKNVLCMEFVQGTKLTRVDSTFDKKGLVRSGVQAFLDMTFKLGVFHGDLHPGNFLCMDDGRLAILDFGLTARLTREMRSTLSYMFLLLVKEDLESFSRVFVDLTDAGYDVDRGSLEAEIRDTIEPLFSARLGEIQVGTLLMKVAQVSAAKDAPVSRDLIAFFRALVALEAFGKTLDPQFQILKEATEYARTMERPALNSEWLASEAMLFLRDSHVLLKELPATIRMLSKRANAGQLTLRVHSEELNTLSREIDRASNRLSLAMLLGTLVMGGSILTYGKQGKLFDSLATLGLIGFGVAGFLGIWLIVSILRSGRFK